MPPSPAVLPRPLESAEPVAGLDGVESHLVAAGSLCAIGDIFGKVGAVKPAEAAHVGVAQCSVVEASKNVFTAHRRVPILTECGAS
jgi:hypothetical protein